MKNKGLKSLLLLPLAAGLLAGCGGGGSKADVTIKFWHTFGQTIQDGLKAKIQDFKKAVKEHDGLSVEVSLIYQGDYNDIAKKISDGYGVGNKPTIAVAYPDNVADYIEIGKAAGEEFVVDIGKFANNNTYGFGKEAWLGDEYDDEDFVQEFYEEGSKYSKEGTYSLPFMKSTEIMFYNYDMLETAMTYYDPTINSETKIQNFMKNLDWDTFMDLCACIKEHKSAIGNLLEVPAYYDSDSNFFITKMYQNEIPFASITNEGRGAIDFANEPALTKTRQMLEDFYDYGHDELLTTKGVVNKYGRGQFFDY